MFLRVSHTNGSFFHPLSDAERRLASPPFSLQSVSSPFIVNAACKGKTQTQRITWHSESVLKLMTVAVSLISTMMQHNLHPALTSRG